MGRMTFLDFLASTLSSDFLVAFFQSDGSSGAEGKLFSSGPDSAGAETACISVDLLGFTGSAAAAGCSGPSGIDGSSIRLTFASMSSLRGLRSSVRSSVIIVYAYPL